MEFQSDLIIWLDKIMDVKGILFFVYLMKVTVYNFEVNIEEGNT